MPPKNGENTQDNDEEAQDENLGEDSASEGDVDDSELADLLSGRRSASSDELATSVSGSTDSLHTGLTNDFAEKLVVSEASEVSGACEDEVQVAQPDLAPPETSGAMPDASEAEAPSGKKQIFQEREQQIRDLAAKRARIAALR